MTEQKLIVMDYDDLKQAADYLVNKIVCIMKEQAAATPADNKSELMTPKEVKALFDVTDKTLFVWNKIGFLPRIKIGGVVRYNRTDVERAYKVKQK